MPSGTEPDPLRHELVIAAPPDVVFPYFTDPSRMTSWMGLAALLDPRPGGAFRIDANGRDVVLGKYVAVDPPRRVVFTWGFEGDERALPPGATQVEVTLERDGDGTRVVLLHHGLPDPARAAHDAGWTHYLARLGSAAAGNPPEPDPWIVNDR
jgi:uncharacterized protein YndB with AHSA1/START domain